MSSVVMDEYVKHPGREALFAAYTAVWGGVIGLTCLLYQEARLIGGTLPVAVWLHPVLFGLTVWPVLREYLEGKAWLDIANGVLFLIYVYCGLGLAYYVLHFEEFNEYTALTALRIPEFAMPGMMVVLVGTIFYRIGARGPWLKRLVRCLPTLPPTPRWSTALRLGVIAGFSIKVMIVLFFISSGFFGFFGSGFKGYYSLLLYLEGFGNIALLTGLYYWFSGFTLKPLDKLLFGVFLGILFAGAVIHGSKSAVFELLMFAGVPYLLLRKKLPWRVLFPLGFFFMFLFALNPVYREVLSKVEMWDNRFDMMQGVFTRTRHDFEASHQDGIIQDGLDRLWLRTSMFSYLLPVIEKTPDLYDYRQWERYPYLLPAAFIPRVLWPDKLEANQSITFNLRYINHIPNSTTPTTFGWAYMEQGYWSVAFLMLVMGLTARGITLYTLGRHGPTLAATMLFTVSFRTLFNLETDPYWLLNGLFKELVTAILAYVVIVKLSRVAVEPQRAHARG